MCVLRAGAAALHWQLLQHEILQETYFAALDPSWAGAGTSGRYPCTQIIQTGDEEGPEQLSPDQGQVFPACPLERGLEMSLGSIRETVLHHSHCKSKEHF